ncbi:protein involved in polysaccharide export with SLBB domain [Roseivirga pacifica]|uniref:Protein involved in polysaccharide export, contains SLBB domain of the beta-grasp fold n=1 Tax=Roseivirga pacifica TaxID=1267423 RepID=A0A1I0N7I5_9BACT|nr:SLBB domain-containing protein [Roseivirga pacifica]RKQ50965.1 protein involved in polysaccharide export with SLBB domain [Roseivirga pacifica]SEV96787.1 protein involved in polysaccharide export, contains SLBB domain of the beta-grasp fold [Roseivirga pacifica]
MRAFRTTRLPLFLIGFFVVVFGLKAQTLPDFTSVNISELSDQQIELMMKQAQAMGYSSQDIISLAQVQGVSQSDLSLLSERFNAISSARVSQGEGAPITEARLRGPYIDSLESVNKKSTDIYGLDVFRKGSFLSFQTTQNIATPIDYKLGAGDEVFIDIYGASENYYRSIITPDGTVVLENIGPISLSGLTIEQAEARIKQRFSKIYEGLRGESSNTNLTVSLGKVRSVNINVVGLVEIPGTYNLSALNTVFNALYAAGGVTEDGTLREIKHFRKGKLISTVDIYEFLSNGYSEGDNRLESGDVILIQPYTNRVTLNGAAKISGRFELKADETVSDLLAYAGGFSENAFTETIKLSRILDGEKRVADVSKDQFEIFEIKPGDVYTISEVLNRFANRVVVQGAVFRPGNYAVTQGMTMKELITKTEGLRPDAFLDRAIIKRTKPDLTTETISFNLSDIINGEGQVLLRKEDVITIFSKNEIKEEAYIEVLGETNDPQLIEYSEGTTLHDAILLAGGLTSYAFGGTVEVSRRVLTDNVDGFNLSETQVFSVDLNNGLVEGGDFELLPFDQIIVRRNPHVNRQQLVAVEGQVNSPGQFAIANQGERISDLLKRAGGINQFAFIEGATLIRKTEFYDEPTDIEQQIEALVKLQQKFNQTPELLTESELALLQRIESDIQTLEERNANNQSLSDYAKKERIREVIERNGLSNIKLKQAEAIGIDLQKILNSPGSASDLLIEEGDVLIIPKKTETVRSRGKLLYPTTSRFIEGKSLKYYINNAGGFDYRAKKKGTYVVYANGDVARTKSFLFMKFYPKAAPGAEIIVPSKPLRVPVRVQDVLAVTSGLATLVLVITQINN